MGGRIRPCGGGKYPIVGPTKLAIDKNDGTTARADGERRDRMLDASAIERLIGIQAFARRFYQFTSAFASNHQSAATGLFELYLARQACGQSVVSVISRRLF